MVAILAITNQSVYLYLVVLLNQFLGKRNVFCLGVLLRGSLVLFHALPLGLGFKES